MSSRNIALGALGAIALVSAAAYMLSGHRKAATAAGGAAGKTVKIGHMRMGHAQAPVPVTVVAVSQREVPVYLSANGTVQAHNKVTVTPQVGGQLLKLTFSEGQQVSKGAVLARIDARAYRSQYDQMLAEERRHKVQLASAQSKLKRYQRLISKHFISAQDLEDQRNTVRQFQASVQADRASVRDAKVKLDYATVRAPIQGLSGIRKVDPGNVLAADSTAIVTLTQIHPIDVIFSLPAQDMNRVRRAQAKGTLSISAIDSSDSHIIAADGRLSVVDNQIDVSTGSFQLKGVFSNKASELWPGQFVNVRLHVSTLHKALVVPTAAVQRGPHGDYVYVVKADKTVTMRPVSVRGEDGDSHMIIGKGLALGERVVTAGQFRLKQGVKVTPRKPGQVPKAATAAQIKKAAARRGGHGHRH